MMYAKVGNVKKSVQYAEEYIKRFYEVDFLKSEDFLNKTTDENSDGRHKIKSVNELEKILEELKKT